MEEHEEAVTIAEQGKTTKEETATMTKDETATMEEHEEVTAIEELATNTATDEEFDEEFGELFDFETSEKSTASAKEVALVDQEQPAEDEFPDLNNFEELEPLEYPTRSAVGGGEASLVRIINHKNGKRLTLKKEMITKLNLDGSVQVGLIKDTIVFAKNGLADIDYELRKQDSNYNVYNAALVKKITKALNLDFSKVSSKNLSVKFSKVGDKQVLMARK